MSFLMSFISYFSSMLGTAVGNCSALRLRVPCNASRVDRPCGNSHPYKVLEIGEVLSWKRQGASRGRTVGFERRKRVQRLRDGISQLVADAGKVALDVVGEVPQYGGDAEAHQGGDQGVLDHVLPGFVSHDSIK